MAYQPPTSRFAIARPTVLAAVLAASAVLVGCGKVNRQMTINSNPQGALVYLNDQEVGRTPCTVDFTWYGKYDVNLRKDGYESVRTTQNVTAPWWQWIPLDLVSELTPGLKVDRRSYTFSLPVATTQPVDPSVLIDRGLSMKPMLESGEFTRKPTTRSAVATTHPATTQSAK